MTLRPLTSLAAAALLFSGGCGSTMTQEQIDTLLRETKTALVPDRRTQAFDVTGTVREGALVVTGQVHDAALKERLLAHLRERSALPVVDSVLALPDPELGERRYGIVSVSVANMRRRPDHDEEMVTQAILGTPVRILEKRGAWLLIQTPDDYLGWAVDNVGRTDSAGFDAWARRPKVIVTEPSGWVRTAKDQRSDPVGDVVAGGILALRGEEGTFYAVEFPDGRDGYLAKSDGEPYTAWLAKAKDTPQSIVATARRFFGVPYLWGGTSAKGMDCSGYTKTVYFLNGVLLPRDAGQQWLVGEAVDTTERLESVQPGDLLFFGSRPAGTRPARVTHVAIYLGGGKYIHTPGDAGTTGICVNSLFPEVPEYARGRAEGFLGVRRMIGAGPDMGVRRLRQLPWYASRED